MSAAIQHPAWCDTTECRVSPARLHHSHRSAPSVIPKVDPNPVTITLQLSQGHTDKVLLVLLDIDLGDGDDPIGIPLYVLQALTLAQKLRRIVGIGTRPPRQRT